MPSTNFDQRTRDLLRQLESSGQYKHLQHVTSPMGATVTLDGVGEVIVMCSNNYLGLANHPEVVAAGLEGLRRYGAGTASVRFICGTFDCHRTVERTIARYAGTDAALTYVSAWNANEALIGTIAGPEDALISDELNHASIIDGMRLMRGTAKSIYKHSDMADLEAKLRENRK